MPGNAGFIYKSQSVQEQFKLKVNLQKRLSKEPTLPLEDYVYGENRFRMLKKSNPEVSQKLIEQAQKDVKFKFSLYKQLSEIKI